MKKAFSLMEMMIILLVTAIATAASIPMINHKSLSIASGKSPWIWSGDYIAYNIKNSQSVTASIGTFKVPIKSPIKPRLYIETSEYAPALELGYKDSEVVFKAQDEGLVIETSPDPVTNTVRNVLNINKNRICIGNATSEGQNGRISIGENSNADYYGASKIAIGGAKATGKASIAIGKGAKSTSNPNHDKPSIAVGGKAQALIEDSIALGNNSYAKGKKAISVGAQYDIDEDNQPSGALGDYSIALGKLALADAGNISIGYNTATMINSSQVNDGNSISIGANANTNKSYNVVIAPQGNSTSTTSANRSVAIGKSSEVSYGEGGVAIGYKAVANKGKNNNNDTVVIGSESSGHNRDVVIGTNSSATSEGVVIGNNSNSGLPNNTIIGNGLEVTAAQYSNNKTSYSNAITLGNPGCKVYIPGKLLVGTNFEKDYLALRGNLLVKNYLMAGNMIQSETYHIGNADEDYFANTDLAYAVSRYYPLMNSNDPHDAGALSRENIEYSLRDAWKALGSKYSDKRLKNIGKIFTGGLDEVKKLQLFNYTFKDDSDKTRRVGVIAQDLQKIFPAAVIEREDGFLRIRMEDMFYSMVNAIKEIANTFDAKNKELAELEKESQELLKRAEELENRLIILEKSKKDRG